MKKIAIVALVSVVIVGGVVAIGVSQLRPTLEQQLSEALGAPVTIVAVRWAPMVNLRLQAMTIQYPGDLTVQMDWVDAAPDWAARAVRYRGEGLLRAASGPLGNLQIEGRTTQDQTTDVRLTLDSRSLSALAPYLQQAVGAAATAGELTVEVQARTQADMVEAQVRVEARHLAFPPATMTTLGVEANRLVQLLQDDQRRIQLEFPVRGRRDQLEVHWEDVVASALQQALRSTMARQMQQTIVEGLVGQHPALNRAPVRPSGQPATPGGEPASLEDRLKAIGKQLKQQLKGTEEPEPAQTSSDPSSPQ